MGKRINIHLKKGLFLFISLLFLCENIKATGIDSCYTSIVQTIDSAIKNTLPMDSLCSYYQSSTTNSIRVKFKFNTNLELISVELYSRYEFTEIQKDKIIHWLINKSYMPLDCTNYLQKAREVSKDSDLVIFYKPNRKE
jgi:hypothetical protein